MLVKERRLQDLISVGPAMLGDFELLGVRSVEQLAKRNPKRMYEMLCRRTNRRSRAPHICDDCERPGGIGQCARSRRVGSPPRTPAISHLDGALMAGSHRHCCKAASPSGRVFGKGTRP